MGKKDNKSHELQENQKGQKNKDKKFSVYGKLLKLAHTRGIQSNQKEIQELITNHLQELINSYSGCANYHVIYLCDEKHSINDSHANKIYQAISSLNKEKDIFLIIDSRGGSIEPAYLISKTCKRLAKDKFLVAVPRKAKSAATLICLGADEIHMGLMSELGPIDPQIGGLPVQGLSNALEVIAKLAEKYPNSSDMFAKYLKEQLILPHLGYFERLCESAQQYANRLLQGKKLPEQHDPGFLSSHFVYHYKDHSFVIDSDETIGLLGPDIVKINSDEYNLSNEIYKFFNFVSTLFDLFQNKEISFVGETKNCFSWSEIEKE